MREIKNLILLIGDLPLPMLVSNLNDFIPQFKLDDLLDAIVEQINNFDQKIYHKDPWHVQVFESEKVQELADLKRKELEASINLEKAMPNG